MTERRQPYVGISGITDPERQQSLAELAEELRITPRRKLLLGVKAVHNTQWLDRQNKYGRRWYPVGEEFSSALVAHEATINTAQMYFEPDAIKAHPSYTARFTERVMHRGRAFLNAIQFDMLPYDQNPEAWRWLPEFVQASGLQVIIQCHQRAMSKDPREAIDDLKRLSPELDYVLFDASHGKGREMDSSWLKKFLEVAYNDPDFTDNGTNFGIAGGLDATSVYRHIPSIQEDYPEVSWDAEGQLHQSSPDGSLDPVKTKNYLAASSAVLERFSLRSSPRH